MPLSVDLMIAGDLGGSRAFKETVWVTVTELAMDTDVS